MCAKQETDHLLSTNAATNAHEAKLLEPIQFSVIYIQKRYEKFLENLLIVPEPK
jgi:hypothetical protein